MTLLTMVVTPKTVKDYDDADETIKVTTGDLDGISLRENTSCPSAHSDAACKTSFKTLLTDKGYTWDTEA